MRLVMLWLMECGIHNADCLIVLQNGAVTTIIQSRVWHRLIDFHFGGTRPYTLTTARLRQHLFDHVLLYYIIYSCVFIVTFSQLVSRSCRVVDGVLSFWSYRCLIRYSTFVFLEWWSQRYSSLFHLLPYLRSNCLLRFLNRNSLWCKWSERVWINDL